MVIVLIRTALRADVDMQEYEALNTRMVEIVQGIPGFVSVKGYRADDGDEVSIARFESQEALSTWRNHPEHLETQRKGRERLFRSYDIQICEVVRAYGSGGPAGH
jgi:heme-degrading monooxygenase HmoA